MATYRIIKETQLRIDGDKVWFKVTKDGEYVPNSYGFSQDECESFIKRLTESPQKKEEVVKEVIIND